MTIYESIYKKVAPPERLTVSECAQKYRFLRNEGSYIGGWDNSTAPYLTEIMDTFANPEFNSVVFVAPARCGKTDIIYNWILWGQMCHPMNMLMVHMTKDTAGTWSRNELSKALRDSPALMDCVGRAPLKPGQGAAKDINVFDLYFKSGTFVHIGWPVANQLSGFSYPRVALTDLDRMSDNIDGEGAPFDLARKRTQTFGSYAMTYAESSPSRDVESNNWAPKTAHEAPPARGIIELYNKGDRRRYYWRCFKCHEAFEPGFKHMTWVDSDDYKESAESATMKCPHCGFKHTFHASADGGEGRHALNLGGKWIKDGHIWQPDGSVKGVPQYSDIASFWLKGACAAFQKWPQLVLRYLQARDSMTRLGDYTQLKATMNLDQCEIFTPPTLQAQITADLARDRAQQYPQSVVPKWVRYLTAAIDVQGNRFEVQVVGWGVEGTMTVIDRFPIHQSKRINPNNSEEKLPVEPGAYIEDWDLLREMVIEKVYPLWDGSHRVMAIKMVTVDCGGSGETSANAYGYWRYLRDSPEHNGAFQRFMLVRGSGSANPTAPRVRWSYPDSSQGGGSKYANARGDVPVLLLNSNMIKDMAFGYFVRAANPAGSRMIYGAWLPNYWFREMTNEVRIDGKWQQNKKHNKRNESFDLTCYNIAVNICDRVGGELIDWDNPPVWAKEWDKNSLVANTVADVKKKLFKPAESPLAALARASNKMG